MQGSVLGEGRRGRGQVRELQEVGGGYGRRGRRGKGRGRRKEGEREEEKGDRRGTEMEEVEEEVEKEEENEGKRWGGVTLRPAATSCFWV